METQWHETGPLAAPRGPARVADRLAPAVEWQVRAAGEDFQDLLGEWEQLAEATARFSFAGAGWTASYLDALLPQQLANVALHVLRCDGRLVAVLPLRRGGWPLRMWRSLQNGALPACGPVLDEREPHLAAALLKHLVARSDGIRLEGLHPDGALVRELLRAAGELGLHVQLEPQGGAGIVLLDGPWQELRPSLPQHVLRQAATDNLHLQQKGQISLEVVESGSDVIYHLDECAALETVSWGARTTAPASLGDLVFYRRLAERAALSGCFSLYLLSVERRLVAFEYCLRGLHRLHHLWSGQDPAHRAHGVRDVLLSRLFEREVERGFRGRVRLGPHDPSTASWATSFEARCRVWVFGHSLAARGYHAGLRLTAGLRDPSRRLGAAWQEALHRARSLLRFSDRAA